MKPVLLFVLVCRDGGGGGGGNETLFELDFVYLACTVGTLVVFLGWTAWYWGTLFELDDEDGWPNTCDSLGGGAIVSDEELLSNEGGGGKEGRSLREGGGGKLGKFGSGGRFPKLGGGGGGGNPADTPVFLPMFISNIFLALANSSELPFISYLSGRLTGSDDPPPPPCFCSKNALSLFLLASNSLLPFDGCVIFSGVFLTGSSTTKPWASCLFLILACSYLSIC